MEGLTLTDVFYKGRKVLAQASLPVVRVKYRGNGKRILSGCGPYPDKFYSFNLAGRFSPAASIGTVRPYPRNPELSNVVQFVTRSKDGTDTLGVYVYAKIGGYILWQGWNLNTIGRMDPVVYSSGWSCSDGLVKNDHRHHPYWRMVFRIDDSENDLWELRAPTEQLPVSRKVVSEQDFTRQMGEELSFVVSSRTSPRHALIRFPAPPNEHSDPKGSPWFEFAHNDAAIRLYKASEDRGWNFPVTDELGYGSPPDSVEHGFTVLWLVSHLGHRYIPGEDDDSRKHNKVWHWTGPSIQLVNWE